MACLIRQPEKDDGEKRWERRGVCAPAAACRSGQFDLTGCCAGYWRLVLLPYYHITMPCMQQARVESSHSQSQVPVNRDVGSPRVSACRCSDGKHDGCGAVASFRGWKNLSLLLIDTTGSEVNVRRAVPTDCQGTSSTVQEPDAAAVR